MLSLEDERQITSILFRYGTGIDQRDWRLFETCFAENCKSDYPGMGHWNSAKEITEYMTETHLGWGKTLHRMTNIVLDGDGDKATGRTYIDAVLVPLDAKAPVVLFAGYYEDEFVKTSSGWKIAYRRLVFVDRVFRDIHPVPMVIEQKDERA